MTTPARRDPAAPEPAARSRLDVTIESGPGGHLLVTVAGELDHGSHLELIEELSEQIAEDRSRLLLDLGGVAFCDSTGLGALVRLHRQAAARGGWVRLARLSGDLRRILHLTNLDRLLAVYDTVQDATDDRHRAVHLAP